MSEEIQECDLGYCPGDFTVFFNRPLLIDLQSITVSVDLHVVFRNQGRSHRVLIHRPNII